MISRWLGYVFAGTCIVVSCLLFYFGLRSRPPGIAVIAPPPAPVQSDQPAPVPVAIPEPPVSSPVTPTRPPLPDECRDLPATVTDLPQDREELIKFCRAWNQILLARRPHVDEARCGPEKVVRQLQALDECAQLNDLCDLSRAGKVDVQLIDILGVSQQFPTFIAYFGYGASSIQNNSALAAFVKREIAADPRRAFMIFGSASPTSVYQAADERVAKDRTQAAFKVVDRTLTRQGAVFVQTRKASVGRGLDANFCDTLSRLPGQRAECEHLDKDARRQAAFIISYPRACLESDE